MTPARKETVAMSSALTEAETALATAKDVHQKTRLASEKAAADAAALRASVKAGRGAKVTATATSPRLMQRPSTPPWSTTAQVSTFRHSARSCKLLGPTRRATKS